MNFMSIALEMYLRMLLARFLLFHINILGLLKLRLPKFGEVYF